MAIGHNCLYTYFYKNNFKKLDAENSRQNRPEFNFIKNVTTFEEQLASARIYLARIKKIVSQYFNFSKMAQYIS